MKYVSTRGIDRDLDFSDVLLAGLARDGGLYVPASWPAVDREAFTRFTDASYVDVAIDVMWPYVEGSAFERDEFAAIVSRQIDVRS